MVLSYLYSFIYKDVPPRKDELKQLVDEYITNRETFINDILYNLIIEMTNQKIKDISRYHGKTQIRINVQEFLDKSEKVKEIKEQLNLKHVDLTKDEEKLIYKIIELYYKDLDYKTNYKNDNLVIKWN